MLLPPYLEKAQKRLTIRIQKCFLALSVFSASKQSEWMHLQDQRDQNRVAMQKQKFCLLKLFSPERLGNNTVIAKLAHIVFLKQGWWRKTKKLLQHFFPSIYCNKTASKEEKERGSLWLWLSLHTTTTTISLPNQAFIGPCYIKHTISSLKQHHHLHLQIID